MRTAVAFIIVTLMAASTAGAQDYDLSWHTIDGGGEMFSTGGTYELSGTIGQPDASMVAMVGANYELTGGFWPSVPTSLVGDLNCDGVLNAFDIDPFVVALTDPEEYATQYPECDIDNADTNGDGVLNAFDIDPFVRLLTGG